MTFYKYLWLFYIDNKAKIRSITNNRKIKKSHKEKSIAEQLCRAGRS